MTFSSIHYLKSIGLTRFPAIGQTGNSTFSPVQERLSKFLFTYHLTPQSTTGVTPSSLLMGRRIRSRLDALFPSVTSRVEKQQSKQAAYHDSQKALRSFKVGDLVYTKDFSTMPTSWTPGQVTKVTGPLSDDFYLPDIPATPTIPPTLLLHVLHSFSLPNDQLVPAHHQIALVGEMTLSWAWGGGGGNCGDSPYSYFTHIHFHTIISHACIIYASGFISHPVLIVHIH